MFFFIVLFCGWIVQRRKQNAGHKVRWCRTKRESFSGCLQSKKEPQKQKSKLAETRREHQHTQTEEDVFVWHKLNIARTMASCHGFPHCSYTASAFPAPSGCGSPVFYPQSVEYINLASITTLQIVDLMLLRPLVTEGSLLPACLTHSGPAC